MRPMTIAFQLHCCVDLLAASCVGVARVCSSICPVMPVPSQPSAAQGSSAASRLGIVICHGQTCSVEHFKTAALTAHGIFRCSLRR